MPRPTRIRSFVAPSLSRMSLSFMAPSLTPRGVFDAHEVLDLLDHAAHRRGVGQGRAAMQLVQPEADERLALPGVAADRRADLPDRDGAGLSHRSALLRIRRRRRRRRRRSEEHTSELQSHSDLVCRLLLEKKKQHPTPPTLAKKQNKHN